MKKRIFISIATFALILTVGVFFACTLVNNSKEEEMALKPTVKKHGDGYIVTVPVQSGMKYATFYRISSDNKTLKGDNTETQLIAQCTIVDSKATEEGLRIVQIVDDHIDSSVQYYGYYVRYSSGDRTAVFVQENNIGTGEAVLTATNPCMTFYYNKGTNQAKITLDTPIIFPESYLTGNESSAQLAFVIEKTTGSKSSKLITFAVPTGETNVENDTVLANNFCDLSLGLPDDFYDATLKLRGLVGMYVSDMTYDNNDNKVAYKQRYWTNLLECGLKIKGVAVDGTDIDGEDGTELVTSKTFKIPQPAAKDSVDYY